MVGPERPACSFFGQPGVGWEAELVRQARYTSKWVVFRVRSKATQGTMAKAKRQAACGALGAPGDGIRFLLRSIEMGKEDSV